MTLLIFSLQTLSVFTSQNMSSHSQKKSSNSSVKDKASEHSAKAADSQHSEKEADPPAPASEEASGSATKITLPLPEGWEEKTSRSTGTYLEDYYRLLFAIL